MTASPSTRTTYRLRRLWWLPQAALALAMFGAGAAKLAGEPAMVRMFDDIGAGQWFRPVVGGLEVAGALGLLVPRCARYAALGLVVLLTGAVVTNLVVLRTSPLSALVLLAVAAVVATLRWRRAPAGAGPRPGREAAVKPRLSPPEMVRRSFR